MNYPNLITDLTKYTDFNKARAFDKLISDMRDILYMYSDGTDPTATTISEVTARLLSHAWDLLLKNGDTGEPINS